MFKSIFKSFEKSDQETEIPLKMICIEWAKNLHISEYFRWNRLKIKGYILQSDGNIR